MSAQAENLRFDAIKQELYRNARTNHTILSAAAPVHSFNKDGDIIEFKFNVSK